MFSLIRRIIKARRVITLAIVAFVAGVSAEHYGFVHAGFALFKSTVLPQRRPNIRQPNSTESEYRRQRLSYFRAVPGTAEVVMLGDSITQAGEWAELLPGVRVLNRGIAWDTSADLLARLDEVIARNPKIVFLMIGLNDVRQGLPVENVLGNIRQITKRLGDARIRTVLQSALLVVPQLNEPTNIMLIELNRGLRSFAQEAGLVFLDINSLVAKDGALDMSLTLDGFHLTAPAYLKWGTAVASAIQSIRTN